MYGLYHTFNFVTGYKEGNASVKAIEWRLIVLESIAGVPGFVAAGFRHFRSLRRLQRDHGFIATLLEEAENERMHLLVCLQMFEASYVTRAMVMVAQAVMAPLLMTVYFVHPASMHRFVGYLEETGEQMNLSQFIYMNPAIETSELSCLFLFVIINFYCYVMNYILYVLYNHYLVLTQLYYYYIACHTYASVIAQVERPGTQLHTGWAHVDSPDIAKAYWKLPADAKFVDTLKCMVSTLSIVYAILYTLCTIQYSTTIYCMHYNLCYYSSYFVTSICIVCR